MRKASLLLLSILLPLSLYASSGLNVGIEGGYTMGFYDQRGGERPFREFSMGHAFELAIPVEYRVNGWFSVASGLRYIGKPYNMAEDTTAAGGFDFYSSRNVSHFLEVPVSARLSLGNGTMRGFLGAGAYIGVRFLSTESGRLNSQGFLTTAGCTSLISKLRTGAFLLRTPNKKNMWPAPSKSTEKRFIISGCGQRATIPCG